MNLSYDSILGIPTIENTSNNGSKSNVSAPSALFLVIIAVIFIVLFSSLGNHGVANTGESSQNGSSTLLTILLGAVLVVVLLVNGLQYFYNINLTAKLDNLFTINPSVDLIVDQETPSVLEPVPEITEKKQVFHIPGNEYTYDNAEALCKAYGSRLATYDEVEESYGEGAEWCSYGWSDKQLALFPTQKDTWNHLQTVDGHENDCGRPGINGGYIANPNVRFGANCFGYKPKITQEEKDIMNSASLYPKTLKDAKEERLVDYWRQKIPDILVSPFNKSVWSLI